MARTDGFVQMPSFLDVALTTAPGLHMSHHPLRRPVSSSASGGHVIAGSRYGSSSAGCRWLNVDPEVLAMAMVVVMDVGAIKDGNGNIRTSCLPVYASHPPPPHPPLRKANAVRVRGGSATGRVRGNRHRVRRPLRSFFAPALVWIVAACIDYNLWWGQRTAAAALAASPLEGNTRLRLGRGNVAGVFVESAAAYRGHYVCFHVLLGLTLLSHVAVTMTDPGFLPRENHVPGFVQTRAPGRWCDHCKGYKPPRAHHCRRCGACVARMDHHCYFVANCIGMGNHKQFILLLLYSAALAAYAGFFYFRLLFGHGSRSGDVSSGFVNVSNGLFSRRCLASMTSVLLPMSTLLIFAWLAVLLAVQLYGIGVDAGIVDRLQAAAREDRVAEKMGVSSTAAVDTRRRERWAGWPQVAPLSSGSSPFPDANRGVGFGQLQDAASTSGKESPHRPCPVEAFEKSVNLPRGPSHRAPSDGDAGSEPLKKASCCCREFWQTLRQEILGEGAWIMWFVPTPAVW